MGKKILSVLILEVFLFLISVKMTMNEILPHQINIRSSLIPFLTIVSDCLFSLRLALIHHYCHPLRFSNSHLSPYFQLPSSLPHVPITASQHLSAGHSHPNHKQFVPEIFLSGGEAVTDRWPYKVCQSLFLFHTALVTAVALYTSQMVGKYRWSNLMVQIYSHNALIEQKMVCPGIRVV